jgi:pimeloyl-ACP methyl ester carboxylesterase
VVDVPEIRYARTPDDVHVAYQVVGRGPPDVIYANSWMSHIEESWEYPPAARFYDRMAAFCRLILFDRRGTGLSDPIVGAFTMEDRTADIRAVMDAVGLDQAVLLGSSEGGSASIYVAAMYPDRVTALVLYSPGIVAKADDECPWAWSGDFLDAFLAGLGPPAAEWGS